MSLVNLGLLEGATLAATGGTAISFTPANGNGPNQLVVANAAETDFRLRETVVSKASLPVKQNDGTWSKDRRSQTLNIPVYDPVTQTYDSIVVRIERVAPAFSTPAQLVAANILGAQLLFDTDTAAFYAAGSLG